MTKTTTKRRTTVALPESLAEQVKAIGSTVPGITKKDCEEIIQNHLATFDLKAAATEFIVARMKAAGLEIGGGES